MTARVFSFEGDWVSARVRRKMRGWTETISAVPAEVVALPTCRPVNRYVTVFESRDGMRWHVFGLEDWHEATFEQLGGALQYACGIANAADAGVEVYRLDRELSA